MTRKESCYVYKSSITGVTIPVSVSLIGSGAFYNCSGLLDVIFENVNSWQVVYYESLTSGTAIPSADLSDSKAAATLLTETYKDFYWKRS